MGVPEGGGLKTKSICGGPIALDCKDYAILWLNLFLFQVRILKNNGIKKKSMHYKGFGFIVPYWGISFPIIKILF